MPISVSLKELREKINYKLIEVTSEEIAEEKLERGTYVLVRSSYGADAEEFFTWSLCIASSPNETVPVKLKSVNLRHDKIDKEVQHDLEQCQTSSIPKELNQRIKNAITRLNKNNTFFDCAVVVEELRSKIVSEVKEEFESLQETAASKCIFTSNTLEELITNSIDAGATELTVSVEFDSNFIRYVITDNGSGFSEEFLKKDSEFEKQKVASPKTFLDKSVVSEKKASEKSPQLCGGQAKGLWMMANNPFGALIQIKNASPDKINKCAQVIITSGRMSCVPMTSVIGHSVFKTKVTPKSSGTNRKRKNLGPLRVEFDDEEQGLHTQIGVAVVSLSPTRAKRQKL